MSAYRIAAMIEIEPSAPTQRTPIDWINVGLNITFGILFALIGGAAIFLVLLTTLLTLRDCGYSLAPTRNVVTVSAGE